MSDTVENKVRDYLNGKSQQSVESIYRLVYETYSGRLYSFIATILKNKEDAHDVAQNVWEKIFRHFRSFKGNSSLYTWMYRIAYHECINWKKSRDYEIFVSYDTRNASQEGIVPSEIKAETALKWLDEAIQTLPPRQKAVFTLRYFEELSYEKISEITGITEGALKASFHHAMGKVENYLIKKLNENKFQ